MKPNIIWQIILWSPVTIWVGGLLFKIYVAVFETSEKEGPWKEVAYWAVAPVVLVVLFAWCWLWAFKMLGLAFNVGHEVKQKEI